MSDSKKKHFWIGLVAVPLIVGIMGAIATLLAPHVNTSTTSSTETQANISKQQTNYKIFSGEGRAPEGMQHSSSGRILAEKAAFAVAKKNATSYLKGETINSTEKINYSEVEEDKIMININAYIRGIDKYTSEYDKTTGIAKVTVRLSLD